MKYIRLKWNNILLYQLNCLMIISRLSRWLVKFGFIIVAMLELLCEDGFT
jgi:hypothetical protein